MNLIKQIVEEKLKSFNQEKDKGYLDIWSFYQVYALVSVVMEKEFNHKIDVNRIKTINKLWNHLNISLVNKAYNQKLNIKEVNSKTINYFENMKNKDMELINLFLHKSTKEGFEEKKITKKHEKGVIAEVVDIRGIR